MMKTTSSIEYHIGLVSVCRAKQMKHAIVLMHLEHPWIRFFKSYVSWQSPMSTNEIFQSKDLPNIDTILMLTDSCSHPIRYLSKNQQNDWRTHCKSVGVYSYSMLNQGSSSNFSSELPLAQPTEISSHQKQYDMHFQPTKFQPLRTSSRSNKWWQTSSAAIGRLLACKLEGTTSNEAIHARRRGAEPT